MTHEERARIIKRVFMLLLIAAIAAGVYFYEKPQPPAAPAEEAEAVVEVDPQMVLEIIHYTRPGEPASDRVGGLLDRLDEHYGRQVGVRHVALAGHEAAAKAHGVTTAPHTVMLARGSQVFDFKGELAEAEVRRKIDEILHGVERMSDDWRPAVPGMKPAGR